jgi:hypothetical protein
MARWLAATAGFALAVTLVGTWFVVEWVPSSGFIVTARIVLLVGVLLGGFFLVRSSSARAGVVRILESRLPASEGRFATYADTKRRGNKPDLLPLLIRECELLVTANPVVGIVTRRETLLPLLVGAVCLLMLGFFVFLGSSHWQHAAQRLWLGDLIADSQPRIAVSPGDVVAPRGADVVIEAEALGFPADAMAVNAYSQNRGEWESVRMSEVADGKFGFVFVAVGSEVEYYVSSRSVNSERYTIHVAELPSVIAVAVSYEYPDWTNLPVAHRLDGDVTALAGTRVEVTVTTDRPVENGVLVVNGRETAVTVSGNDAAGDFTVEEHGTWYFAVRHEGELARISDVFRIRVAADELPEVTFVWPGRDRQATSIEEVGLRFRVHDDYGVESLNLGYSVNGSPWIDVALHVNEAEHNLFLEDLRTPDGRELRPGDVISFYAEVHDHRQRTRTALYFIDVRPFDKRYRESQQVTGAGEGSGGSELDISQRQKEILSATWNLINKQINEDPASSRIKDEAAVVAMLQERLKDQVEVVIQRAGARMLDRDSSVGGFVEELKNAADAMEPVPEMLSEANLRDAVPAEQRALTHLRTAEATIREVDVSLTRNSRGRGTSQDSLSELIDLEMDPERNRYEMPEDPQFTKNSQAEEAPEWQQLEELANRQEQLARQRRLDEETEASRWQQARLERELEELRQQLANRRQNARSSANELQQAINAVERAQRQMGENTSESQPDPERSAARAMRQAAQSLRRAGNEDMRETLADLRRQVDRLVREQETVMQRLDEVERRTLDEANEDKVNPWQDFSMVEEADSTRRMREELSVVRKDVADAARTVEEKAAETARLLREALSELDEDRIEERLTSTADMFEMGRPLFGRGHEEIVRRGLGRFADRLTEAEQQLARTLAQDDRARPIDQVRGLRESLARLQQGNPAGTEALADIARGVDELTDRLGREGEVHPDFGRDRYRVLGTNPENADELYRMIRTRLDLIEVALMSGSAESIRAQESRDVARDAGAAAEYFRTLSR